jgi:hypothetical protein
MGSGFFLNNISWCELPAIASTDPTLVGGTRVRSNPLYGIKRRYKTPAYGISVGLIVILIATSRKSNSPGRGSQKATGRVG